MTSFGYRFNPRYAIKECSSYGTLYTRDCVCSIRTVEDKILVPKPPKNCARCTRCGYLVDGPNCHRCALLRQELEENLVKHSPDFQNTFEPSNASTNVVNAPREPYVVKQDNGSFMDKIIFDVNRAPDSPDQFHCFYCKDVLKARETCKRCSYTKCGSGLGKGLCFICGHNQNSILQVFLKLLHKVLRISTIVAMSVLPVCYDDDDDEERSDSLNDNIIFGLPLFSAITPDEPVLSTEEPDNSLSMGDEHLDTIPATESDEFIKSSVETLIPIPSESEGIPKHMCDVPFHNNSLPLDVSTDQVKDFSESNEEFSSTDDDSFSFDKIDYVEASPPDSELVSPEGDMLLFEAFLNDDHSSDFKTKSSSNSLNSLLEETNNFHNSLPEFTTFSKVLFDVENKSDSSSDQSSSDEDILKKIISKPLSEEEIIPMKSLRTHDSSLLISSKIDSLLDEFTGELSLLKSIPLGIDETDCDFEEYIRLIEKLLYDNSSPRPSKEFVFTNSDAAIESFSPSPILVKDNDSLMKEIDLFCTPDYPMPPGIVEEDHDSKRDILIPKNFPSNNSLSFAEQKSFHIDIPPFSRPPAKPPDGDTGILNIKMMGDISDQKAFVHKLMITLASHQEKSPDLLSHRYGTVKKFNTHHSHLNTCPMLFHGQNNTPLDVLLFHFIPLDSLMYGGNLVQLI
nr:hypothetical protein [Tanacetum cinerariifolium]